MVLVGLGVSMRGSDQATGAMFSYVDLERRVRRDHPLRTIREAGERAGGRRHLLYLTRRGVPVIGHIGLRPQAVPEEGSFRARGARPDEAQCVIAEALPPRRPAPSAWW